MDASRITVPALAAAAGAYICYENFTFGVTRLEALSPRLPPEFEGFAVALVSDVHGARFGRRLAAVLDSLAPDMVAVAGDLLDSYHPRPRAALALVRDMLRVCPVYFVPGNHEARLRGLYPSFAGELRASGAVVLHDECAELRRGGARILVRGLADPSFIPGSPPFSPAALPKASPSGPYTLLISHRPERFGEYCAAGVDLALCGHAHGGQVRLPLAGPLFAPHQGLFPVGPAALCSAGGTQMAVSRGLGSSRLRLRMNNRPELLLIRLNRA